LKAQEEEATVTGPASGALKRKGLGFVYVESCPDRRRLMLGK